MFHLIRPGTQIDFVGKRFLWIGISTTLILLTVVLFFTRGLNYGIDFTGGAEVQVKVPASWDIGKVRSEMQTGGLKGIEVQEIGLPSDSTYLIKAQGDEKSLNKTTVAVQQVFQKTLQPGQYEIQRVDVVGPAAGS